MLIIDPTAWGEPDDLPDARPVETMIFGLLIAAVLLLAGGIGFAIGRLTA